MAEKKRYLQLSDIIMLEYSMMGDDDICQIPVSDNFVYTKLKDGHYLLFSETQDECESYIDDDVVKYKKKQNPYSINTINHLCVPKDENDSEWYYFIDPYYEYVTNNMMESIAQPYSLKPEEYAKHLDNAQGSKYSQISTMGNVRWDSMRLYFVNGYDFSNTYGLLARIYIDKEDGGYLDLCDFFLTKETYFATSTYLSSPIIFGNNIYDRYVEINLPCLYDLVNNLPSSYANILNIKSDTTIKLNFSYVLEEDHKVSLVEYNISDSVNSDIVNDYVNCSFSQSSSLKGTIPAEKISSDNLGAYIAESQDSPYLEFYATWKGAPLTSDIVWQFNKNIKLYDTSYMVRENAYDVDDDYQAEYNMRKWVAMHDIKLSFCMDDQVIKEENYSMSQIFVSDSDPTVFYYRPMIFDEDLGLYINNIQVVYTMRFLNIDDKVQFVKIASLSLVGNTQKYYAKGTSLKGVGVSNYKVYNKIIENKTEMPSNINQDVRTKFVKVFYSSTDIVLDDNNGNSYGSYNYDLKISQAPKSYKFIFKTVTSEGKYKYMDFTNGSYKLYFKDDGGNVVLIEPTFSKNMNMYLGELEFNLSSDVINKISNVNEVDRKMSIVAYNEDGSVSSIFDFTYSF